jgi:S1-C subfamily serine protease
MAMTEQLRRTNCWVDLPVTNSRKLLTRDVWQRARGSHLRVGWSYLCDKCEHWHLSLAGGFVIASNGVAVTCYHVVQPKPEMKEGGLVAANDEGKLFAVTAVLAASRSGDTCILQLEGEGFVPLPLNTNVFPGDAAFCFSDPLDRRGYFSQGIVNRFYTLPGRRRMNAPASQTFLPTRLHVSTEWAPGSSGSAVLDECGNAIGFVSTIATAGEEEVSDPGETPKDTGTFIVFHEAVAVRDVLSLISPKRASGGR